MTERPLRFTRTRPCPVCGGHDGLVRGQGIRCFGYGDASGDYARCTREDRAGTLPQNRDGTYSHWMHGDCRCGQTHGEPSFSHAGLPAKARRRSAPLSFRSYFTLNAFLRRTYGDDSTVSSWTYHDGEGREAFRVLRIDHADADGTRAKTYRPCHHGSDGRWRLSKPEGLLPLYRLTSVLAAEVVTIIPVLEGEKCADIARGLGLAHATTSAHGAHAPQLSDWSPLAGRRIVILLDEGESGAEYASKVADLLSGLTPPPTLAALRLPGLSDGEDIEQWASMQRAEGRGEAHISTELLALVAGAFD
jgi:hypothetical protein